MNDQIPSRFFGLVHDRFERRSLDGRAESASPRAAVIHVAAHESRNARRPADDDGFIFQPFVPEEVSFLCRKHGEIV